MKWFNEALENIYQPYDVRGLYNRNRLLVLDGGLYDQVMQKLESLEEIHCNSSLDIRTIEGIREDIEADYDNLALLQEEENRRQEEKELLYMRQPEPTEQKTKDFLRHRAKSFPSEKGISLSVDPEIQTNLLLRVEREAIVQVLKMGLTRSQSAKMLGISYRTLTNKISRHFKGVRITD